MAATPSRPEPLEGDLSPIRRDYLPADYARDMAGLGIVKTVHVQNGRNPHDPLDETRWLSGTRRPRRPAERDRRLC